MCLSRCTSATAMSRSTLSGAVSAGYCRPTGAKPMPTPALTSSRNSSQSPTSGDAARYAFAGECAVTQQPSRPPCGYLDEPLVGELRHVDLCLLGQAVIRTADEVQRLARQASHPDARNLVERGSDQTIQFSRLDHRDHRQR